MRKIINLLRDPIWQSIAVLVSVLAIFIGLSDSKINEVSIIPYGEFENLSEYFPDSKIKFTIEGETSNLNNLYYRYFTIQNTSKSSFNKDDFKRNISVKSKNPNVEIALISSCINKKMSGEVADVSSPQFNWIKSDEHWQLVPELFNSDEGGCMIMIVRNNSVEQVEISTSDFVWDGRIVGTRLKSYPSEEAYVEDNAKLSDYMQAGIYIKFETIGIFWFLILQSIFFVVPLFIVRKIHIDSMSNVKGYYFICLFSITTAEILVSKFVDGMPQHPIIWPLLISHFLFFVYLAYKAVNREQIKQVECAN